MAMKIKPDFLKLADRLNTAPRMIADAFGANPIHLEKLLSARGQIREGESVADALARNYGKETADMFRRLIYECLYEDEK